MSKHWWELAKLTSGGRVVQTMGTALAKALGWEQKEKKGEERVGEEARSTGLSWPRRAWAVTVKIERRSHCRTVSRASKQCDFYFQKNK